VRAIVCLPTYNERENLEPMLRALREVLGPGDRVLVIDDNSPDGTGELADRLAGELDFVDVLHRERKEGLGRAYLAGFRRALDAGAEYVLEFDCDFSHDPADVPRLLEAASGADLALGSRYVRGGSVENWGPGRRLVSAGGSLYARIVLGVPIRDLTGASSASAAPSSRRSTWTRSNPRGTRFRSRRRSARCGWDSASSRSRSDSPTARSDGRRCRGRSCSKPCGRCRCSDWRR
jgi:glycosyltransferase involved in cell wall biosynthesis